MIDDGKPTPVVEVTFSSKGSGYVWGIWANRVLIWSHASIEGDPPDALDLVFALARYVPVDVDPDDEEWKKWVRFMNNRYHPNEEEEL